MGTSKQYGGPASGLVPSFVDDPPPPVLQAPSQLPVLPEVPDAPVPPPAPPTTPPLAGESPSSPETGSGDGGELTGARSNFTRFARTRSQSALGSALSQYIRTGTRGAKGAARRMGSSRATAAGLLGLLRNFESVGPTETLRQFDLAGMAGRPATDVFVAILEFVCPAGGSIDEAIARQAMLEAIGDMAEAGVGSFETLTAAQLHEFFLDFISRSIEGRVMADLGHRGITVPDDVAAAENAQAQLHDFVSGCTRGQLARRLNETERLSAADIDATVNEIYEAAFSLLAAAGEAVE